MPWLAGRRDEHSQSSRNSELAGIVKGRFHFSSLGSATRVFVIQSIKTNTYLARLDGDFRISAYSVWCAGQ